MKNILERIKNVNQRLFVMNSATKDGKSALQLCISYNHINAVKFLIEEGASIKTYSNQRNNQLAEFTPLEYACYNGDISLIELLLEKGACVDIKAASSAVEKGKLEVLQFLLDKNPVIVNHKGSDGRALIAVAARNDHLHIVRYLINKGCDINCKDNYKQTPLILAVLHEHTLVVRLLLENNADTSIKDSKQKKAKNYANKEEIINILNDHSMRRS